MGGISFRHSAPAMTWKDRQRVRVPHFDLDDNPFCLERRVNEERHMMQLNRNPSLVHLTSADVPRTASFLVDDGKPFREFSQKKRHLLAWSLRAASATENPRVKPDRKQTSKSASAIPYGLQDIDVEDFFAKQKPACRRRDSNDIDVDTLPTLEPYRREVVTQQPITFGHRPLSGSRMFNPSTMDTSFASSSGGLIGGGGGGGRESGVGSRRRRGQAGVRKQYQSRVGSRTKPRRAPGLSAPMLKALLFGNTQPGGREPKAISLTASTKNVIAQSDSLEFPVRDGEFKLDSAGERRLVQDPDDECSGEDSNWNMWRSVDPAGGGMRGNLDATWLTSSSRGDLRQGKGVHKGGLLEDKELERIFSVNRPPWDGTPIPLPAPRDVRRAVSSLLMPDPDERLGDKIAKSRKIAAGIPVTASSIEDEKKKKILPKTLSGRWEFSPATPRTVMADEELVKVLEAQRKRKLELARRVRQAELRVLYNKITGSEESYRNTLAQGLKLQ